MFCADLRRMKAARRSAAHPPAFAASTAAGWTSCPPPKPTRETESLPHETLFSTRSLAFLQNELQKIAAQLLHFAAALPGLHLMAGLEALTPFQTPGLESHLHFQCALLFCMQEDRLDRFGVVLTDDFVRFSCCSIARISVSGVDFYGGLL
jgi:hypothetical protein